MNNLLSNIAPLSPMGFALQNRKDRILRNECGLGCFVAPISKIKWTVVIRLNAHILVEQGFRRIEMMCRCLLLHDMKDGNLKDN